jgi:hypothetical protein
VNNHFTGLKFVLEPNGGSAGSDPKRAEVALIDEFGNFAAVRLVDIALLSSRVDPLIADPSPVNTSAQTGSDGVAAFEPVAVMLTGKHVFTVRFIHDHEQCIISPEFLQLSDNETERICNARLVAATGIVHMAKSASSYCTHLVIHIDSLCCVYVLSESAPFVIKSRVKAAAVRVKQGPRSSQVAGIPFEQQPICEVLDLTGNLITVHDYQVTLVVENGHGAGCLCDLSEGIECLTALGSPTVQQCASGPSLGCNRILCSSSQKSWVHPCSLKLKMKLMQVNARFPRILRRLPRSKQRF